MEDDIFIEEELNEKEVVKNTNKILYLVSDYLEELMHNDKELYNKFQTVSEDDPELRSYFKEWWTNKIEESKEEDRNTTTKMELWKNQLAFGNFKITLDNYMENVECFHKICPFFYDKQKLFWIWNEKESKYELIDDTYMMVLLDNLLNFRGQTVSSGIKNNYLEAFKRVGRMRIPKDAPSKWIQFNDHAFSLNSSKIYKVTPDYFFTNPIPWKIGNSADTPTIDKLIIEWVGEKYLKTAYEIIAYCCLREYPIHRIFCFVGAGRNGKSKFLGLIYNFIGGNNVTSTELDTLLDSRFESFKLYKKLVCLLGETNFGILNKTSLLKRLTGQDTIGYECKNKMPFDDMNYAKILIASNSLPTTADTSDGFWRRWLILDFPNIFPEGKDILKTIPNIEYENLANKVMGILKTLLSSGEFTKEGSIEERKEKYILSSNPLPMFIKKYCTLEDELYCLYNELYSGYLAYLKHNKKRKVSRKEFKESLENEGFWVERTSKRVGDEFKVGQWIDGVGYSKDFMQFM